MLSGSTAVVRHYNIDTSESTASTVYGTLKMERYTATAAGDNTLYILKNKNEFDTFFECINKMYLQQISDIEFTY